MLTDAPQAKNLSTKWPETSPCKEELPLLRESKNMRLPSTTLRQSSEAGREDDRTELTNSAEVNPWMTVKFEEMLLPGEEGFSWVARTPQDQVHVRQDAAKRDSSSMTSQPCG